MVSRQHPSSFSSSFLLSLIFCLLEDCVKKCEQLCRVTWQSEVNGYLTRACACVCAAAHSGEWALTDMGLCRAYFWNHAAKRRAFRRINWTFFRLHLPQRFISGKLEPLIRPFRPLIDLVPCPHHLHVLCYTCIESQQLLIYFRDSPPLCLHYTNADIPISNRQRPSITSALSAQGTLHITVPAGKDNNLVNCRRFFYSGSIHLYENVSPSCAQQIYAAPFISTHLSQLQASYNSKPVSKRLWAWLVVVRWYHQCVHLQLQTIFQIVSWHFQAWKKGKTAVVVY